VEGLEVWVEERIREITEEEWKELLKCFDVTIRVGKKWIYVELKRENGKETLKLKTDGISNAVHVTLNRQYVGLLIGQFRVHFVKAIGVCKTEGGFWELRMIK